MPPASPLHSVTASLSSPSTLHLLAAGEDIPVVVFRSLILILIVFAGLFLVLRVRRWLKEDDEAPGGIGFTLGDLRTLQRRGEISEEEYERAKAQMVAGAKAMTSKMPSPLARPDKKSPGPGKINP